MGRYFDKDGQPLTLDGWVALFEDGEYRRVAWDELPDGVVVSTVWLGLDHGHGGPRRIFETAAIHGDEVVVGDRYATLEEAMAGHAVAVERLRATPPPAHS